MSPDIVLIEVTDAAAESHPAGDFGDWLAATVAALPNSGAMDVPCGTCNACCRAGYFIHVEPHESAALKAIPKELLFPAPGLPKGHQLMGFNERGECPMLVEGACSIYADRPGTCRAYDCRAFVATGAFPGESAKTEVLAQARLWQFSIQEVDQLDRQAVLATARFVLEYRAHLPEPLRPQTASQLAAFTLTVFRDFAAARDREPAALATTCADSFLAAQV